MNWLESLAANQGVNPEELITDPNARTETAPEWVQKAQNASQNTTFAADTEEKEPAPVTEDEDDPEWLNELGGEEILAPAADSADDVPEWLRETQETPVQAAPPVEEAPVEQDNDDMVWLNSLVSGTEEVQPAAPVEEGSPVSARSTIPTQPHAGFVSDPTIGELGTSSAEQDAAMNWLESLAANQGANPEELITDPKVRTEAAPEWVQKAQDASQSALLAPDAEEVLAQEEVPAEEEAPLAPPVEAAVDESIAEDEEDNWLAEQAKAKLAYDAPTSLPGEAVAEMHPTQEELDSTPTPAQEEPADETPDWLKTMVEEEQASSPAVAAATPPVQANDDLPEWLSDMNKPAEKVSSTASNDDLPEWLKAEETTAPPETLKPTKAEEWKPIAPVAEEKPAAPSQRKPEPPLDLPPRRKVQRMNTTMLRDITLMSAQAAMREGNVTAALAEYGKMIKKKRLLDETIYDLREALYDYPIDVSIWQMLGDAYMRAGRLQEAINAYTKAEELLR